MKIHFLLFLLILPFSIYSRSLISGEQLCSIFVAAHALEKMSDENIRSLNSFRWNYQEEVVDASKNLSPVLLKKINECGERPVIIKAHGYAMTVLYHILGMGKRFAQLFPEHDYVKIYKAVMAVHSIAGIYRGTPLMDRICLGNTLTSISEVLGNKCIYSMTTASVHHPSHGIHSPGVPIYLITSTNRGEENSNLTKILSSYNLSWEEYFTHEGRNQSDGVVPLNSALACSTLQPLIYKDSNCEKINAIYFKDFKRSDDLSHYQLINYDDIPVSMGALDEK